MLLEDAFEETGDETITLNLALTHGDIVAGERHSDGQLLWVSQAGRCNRVVAGHDQWALLEDEVGC